MKEKTTFQKILGVGLSVVAVVGFYLTGKALKIDVVGEFAPYIATAVVAWVVYLVQKWTGLKLDFLNNELVKSKVIEAIVWAEGKAVQAFKLDSVVATGTEKFTWAVKKVFETLPGVSEAKACELVDTYFPQVRPKIEVMWRELAKEIQEKSKLPKPKKK